jgi:hypothetical protein
VDFRPATPAVGSRAAAGRSEGPRSALEAAAERRGISRLAATTDGPRPGAGARPRRRRRGRSPPVSCPGAAGQRDASVLGGFRRGQSAGSREWPEAARPIVTSEATISPLSAQAPLGASLWSSLAPVMVALRVVAAGGGSARRTRSAAGARGWCYGCRAKSSSSTARRKCPGRDPASADCGCPCAIRRIPAAVAAADPHAALIAD